MWYDVAAMKTRMQLIATLALFIGFSALYIDTRTAVHTFDALSYTQDVETKPLGLLYHPHHLLYGPTGYVAVNIAEGLGYEGRADIPIQYVNALAGALGIVALWYFGITFTGKTWEPLPIAALIGACFAYWLYATEVEVYTLAALFIILSLWLLARLEKNDTRRDLILLGLTTAGAVMFHQTNALLVLPIAVFVVVLRQNWRDVVLYGTIVALAVGIPYIGVGLNSGFRSVDDYYNWLTDYAQTGQWGGYLSFDHLDALQTGLTNTITPHHSLLPTAFYALAIIGLALGFIQTKRVWWVFGLTWLLLYGGFFWWWEPWNIEFWIALLPLWALLMLAGLRAEFKYAPTIIASLAGLLAIGLLLAQGDPIREAANAENDYYQQVTQTLDPYLAETDLVVSRGNILDLYVPFYAEHPPSNVISLREIQLSGDTAINRLIDSLTPAYQRGQIIYIDQIVLDEPHDPQRNPFGLSMDDINELHRRFPISAAIGYDGQNAFYSIGQRVSDTTTWTFEQHLGGWLEFGAIREYFNDDGWCIDGGEDPWLESPPVMIDTARYSTIEIEMSIDGVGAGFGQLYWQRPTEGLAEDRSQRFDLALGRQIYTLELEGAQGWEDTITFLRLDPIQAAPDVTACIYRIALAE